MGQALKREATTGESVPHPLAAAKMALAPGGPSAPSGAQKRDVTLASDLASHAAWPSPKYIPGPGLGKKAWGQDLG